MSSLFPILLAVHVTLAVSLFVPSLLLPFALGRGRDAAAARGPVVRALLWLQANGTLLIGAGLAATGIAMLAAGAAALLSQPWLLLALFLYAVNLGVALFIQRPGLRRLLGLRGDATDADRERWRLRARRQRYVSYLMATGVGFIAFLMVSKPAL